MHWRFGVLHRYDPSPRSLAVARQCGERLLTRAQPMDRGIGWLTSIAKARPLSGFAHGAAGIAWALWALADVTGEERFRAAAIDGIAHERSLFSAEHRNWLDLRELPRADDEHPAAACATAWCHGAPGIGLGRLAMLGSLDSQGREEIQVALATMLETGFGNNHSLCHGDLGNVELLSTAAKTFDDLVLQAKTQDIVSGIVERIERAGWLCGNPLQVESPGLMTGLAGIGYGLLRLADPDRVPSVLLLAPPLRVR
jgi:lantibiotic modifying enzyme